MKGGALALLAWSGLLLALMTTCAIWTNSGFHAGELAFAAGAIWVLAAAVAIAGRGALRKGEPEAWDRILAVPAYSLASMLAGVALALIAFAGTFGQASLYIGGGLLLACAGRLSIELRAQRRARARALAAELERDRETAPR